MLEAIGKEIIYATEHVLRLTGNLKSESDGAPIVAQAVLPLKNKQDTDKLAAGK